jgi:hypothetical protein
MNRSYKLLFYCLLTTAGAQPMLGSPWSKIGLALKTVKIGATTTKAVANFCLPKDPKKRSVVLQAGAIAGTLGSFGLYAQHAIVQDARDQRQVDAFMTAIKNNNNSDLNKILYDERFTLNWNKYDRHVLQKQKKEAWDNYFGTFGDRAKTLCTNVKREIKTFFYPTNTKPIQPVKPANTK